MKRNYYFSLISSMLLFLVTIFSELSAQELRPVHLGFFYPLSTNGAAAANYSNNLSIHALAGLSGGETGFAIYGLGGLVKGDVTGFQSAGLWLSVSGQLQGAQVAGLVSRAGQADMGVQVAGLVNSAKQGSGVQLAGLVNTAATVEGAQLAGIANFTGRVSGIQLSGILNQAKDVDGVQVSGLVNKAGTVKGMQLSGLINIAETSDYPVGIINLISDGEKRIGVSVDENLTQLVSFRSGGKRMYGILGLGSNFYHEDLPYALETGVGIRLLDRKILRLDLEGSHIWGTNFEKWGGYAKSGLRLLPVAKLSKRLQLYAGPSLNYLNTRNPDGPDLAKYKIWDRYRSQTFKAVHWGFNAGIQVNVH
ncbi:hypothetical protein SAMN04488057_102150 [Cyclobacterium lianum]|uniref:Uncharacterized protein n=1 Tax=Cyclobacterium lianum TaxID=388280 RepID=A0A1M7JT55_9BACT|nr:hypothetical protein [Cyclobacterium lianum]SHM56174.1 hypothetical protein SAMN04488057_102150 [Cyclobacterium lianum]